MLTWCFVAYVTTAATEESIFELIEQYVLPAVQKPQAID